MSTIIKKQGYDFCFDENACKSCAGRCCTGESGYIWVNNDEIEAITKFLNLEKSLFINEYLLKVRYRFTLKEFRYEGGYSCVFFDLENKKCTIYEARPTQCRTFPFWEHFKSNIKEVETECPGVIRL
ncbi:MAG: YkgJ family cysteine cluster protein [Sulfurospirillaceae bacterium]|nr:YkgJ family cysteine cluster protein [Sulfurospirillaceae bacterium]